jgi:hypothetical protein
MRFEGLTQDQSWALIEEMTSARNLLAYGGESLRSAPFIETTLDPILSLLSIGVEKLQKLLLGVVRLDESGSWPTFDQMRAYRHNLVSMHEATMIAIRGRTSSSSEFVRNQVAGVDADPILPLLIATLDRYAREGRFYNLDRLAERTQRDEKPYAYWSRVERSAINEEPLASQFAAAMADTGNQRRWDEFHASLQGRVADSLDRWWDMICWAGKNHALGKTGRALAFEVERKSVGRQR